MSSNIFTYTTVLVILFSCYIDSASPHNEKEREKSPLDDIFVVNWKYHEYSLHVTLMLFILIVVLFQTAYHKLPVVSKIVPESLLLIILGVLFGALLRFGLAEKFDDSVWRLKPKLFFEILLPPIILESSYSLYNRTFGEYLGSILLYAILGTIANFFLIGFGLYGLYQAGAMGGPDFGIGLKGYLLFASLIVAVDPVAVLAIFQDIGVDYSLYYMVFGESLLNDAVTIVLYSIMEKFIDKTEINSQQIILGIISFFTIAVGGLIIGVICGVITCLMTRIPSHSHFIIVLVMGYFSYIIADAVGWSGLISMIGCGLVQAAYAFNNIDSGSVTVVRRVTKQVALISEAIVFLFLGIELLAEKLEWHTGFMLWSIVICLVARTIVVIALTGIINWVRVDTTKISFKEQLILIYGGLRGAVAFSLAMVISEESFATNGRNIKNLFVTGTLWIIFITVGLMGTTMKPMVKLLNVKMAAKKEYSLFGTLNNRILDYSLAAIETIISQNGRNRMRDFFMNIDDRYIRRILQREPKTSDQKIVEVYEKMALKLHYATVQPARSTAHLSDLPKTLQMKHLNSSISLTKLNQTSISSEFEPGFLYEIKEDGQIIKCERKRSETDYTDFEQISQLLRSNNRICSSDFQQNQETFATQLRDILKSKGLVIRRKSQSRDDTRGRENMAYSRDEESFAQHSTRMPCFTLGEVSREDQQPRIHFNFDDGTEHSRH